jgi:hypothetical protein
MYFLLSGEGPTDMGHCDDNVDMCEGTEHNEGPMAIIVSQIVEQKHQYSFVESGAYGYVSKGKLVERASVFKQQRKSPRLPGAKTPKETRYFYRNARALALCAKEKEAEINDRVVGVFFRDSDDTVSAGRGLWEDKQRSMLKGFADEDFRHGVPMVPKPTSEAWIICALKNQPYQGCEALEDRSGSDKSPNPLKKELAEILNGFVSREKLCEMVNDGEIDIRRINMPSFRAFQERLNEVIRKP